jgi:hypothetical protein
VGALSDAGHAHALRLLQQSKLELQDIELQDVRREGRGVRQRDWLRFPDRQQDEGVCSAVRVM